MAIATTNPTTGEVVKSFEPLTSAQIEQKLQLAASAFRSHRRTSFADRAAKMMRAAEILEKEKDECAYLMTLEMGKPLKAAVAEALKCATGCRYYAENAEKFLADEIVETGAKRSFIRYLPIGPILAIMPWYFPFWQVFRFEAAVATAVDARVQNNGQSCIAAKRFIVSEKIADEFERKFVKRMQDLRVGDPFEESTQLGPLTNADAVTSLDADVKKTVAAGARVLTGGHPLDRPGNFYAPTVLADIPKDSPAYKEEFFGPVASIFRVKDVDQAIQVANDSRFGLGASAWTNDPAETERFINELDAGMVFLNKMVASDPRLPFGGVKFSGHGRELAEHGIREFVNIKTVWIQ